MSAISCRGNYRALALLSALGWLLAACATPPATPPTATAPSGQAAATVAGTCNFTDPRQRLQWLAGRQFAGTWAFARDPNLQGPVTARFGSVAGEPAIMWASSGVDRKLKEPRPYALLMDNQGMFLFQTPNGQHTMRLDADCVLRARQDARQGPVYIELRQT